MEKNRVWP